MNTDVATLQSIADTLEQEPMERQRVLAENAGMSIGLMTAVLKRFVERGWIMLTKVNMRKLAYAVILAGIAELTSRSQAFAKRNFLLTSKDNDKLCKLMGNAKKEESRTKMLQQAL